MSEQNLKGPEEGRELNKMEKDPLLGGTVYKPVSPGEAVVISNEKIVPDGHEEVNHVVLDLKGADYRYLEGQSLGVLPPGENEKGKPHKVRLYSIASARDGDRSGPDTVALSVKRVVYDDPDSGETVRGVASNYICDFKPGEKVRITGPVGKAFAMPADESTNLIFFATGTGIAPFRAFLYRAFRQGSPFKGTCYLFYGVRKRGDLIYLNEQNNDLDDFKDRENLKIVTALSRENPDGSKVYVQHRLAEHGDAVWDLMDDGNFAVYICGLKGMEKGIDDSFREIAARRGKDWDAWKAAYKKEGRWNQEVY